MADGERDLAKGCRYDGSTNTVIIRISKYYSVLKVYYDLN